MAKRGGFMRRIHETFVAAVKEMEFSGENDLKGCEIIVSVCQQINVSIF